MKAMMEANDETYYIPIVQFVIVIILIITEV